MDKVHDVLTTFQTLQLKINNKNAHPSYLPRPIAKLSLDAISVIITISLSFTDSRAHRKKMKQVAENSMKCCQFRRFKPGLSSFHVDRLGMLGLGLECAKADPKLGVEMLFPCFINSSDRA